MYSSGVRLPAGSCVSGCASSDKSSFLKGFRGRPAEALNPPLAILIFSEPKSLKFLVRLILAKIKKSKIICACAPWGRWHLPPARDLLPRTGFTHGVARVAEPVPQ